MTSNPNRTGIPDGYHTTTPYLIVTDADRAVGYCGAAFGAVELRRSVDPKGIVRNVQIRIGDSLVMLGIRAEGFPVDEQKSGDLPRVSFFFSNLCVLCVSAVQSFSH